LVKIIVQVLQIHWSCVTLARAPVSRDQNKPIGVVFQLRVVACTDVVRSMYSRTYCLSGLGLRILDHFSTFHSIAEYGILRDLLAYRIQSPAAFCRGTCISAAYAVVRCLSICLGVCLVRVLCRNEQTYSQSHTFFHHLVDPSF